MAGAAPPVNVAEIEGRGRSLIATQPLNAGQIVLRDSPIILYSAFPLLSLHHQEKSYCSHCFRSISTSSIAVISCCWCSSCFFCSPGCHSSAVSSSHTPWVCNALKRLRDATSLPADDLQVQVRFLVAAYNLAVVSPPDFQTLLNLQGDHIHASASSSSSLDDAWAPVFLHSLISSVCPPNQTQFGFSPELTAALLAKDKLNAFGLMEPFANGKERSVRAYGIYPRASFFNHDCLPNACRFDYVDSTDHPGNTDIIVRVIHDVPQGREICLSYFPVNLKYSDRQRRLKEDYGFVCNCDRCRVEANWSDQEDEEDVEDEEVAMDEDDEFDDQHTAMAAEADEGDASDAVEQDNDFPHAYFFLKYMCSRENCWGTLAPIPPSGYSSPTLMECNVCGNLSNCDELADEKPLE